MKAIINIVSVFWTALRDRVSEDLENPKKKEIETVIDK